MSAERTHKPSIFSRTSKVVAALCPPVLLATLALVNQGVPLSQLELNDGTVWLTSNAEMKMGRYNPRRSEERRVGKESRSRRGTGCCSENEYSWRSGAMT